MKNLTIKSFQSVLLFILIAIGVSADGQTIVHKTTPALPVVKSLTQGRMSLTLGKIRRLIDLSKDISGCLTVYDGTNPKAGRSDVTQFQMVDKTAKSDEIYLVLLATSQGNCNVQGQCGAAQDSTLFWLKLDKTLQVKDKQVAIVESCLNNINPLSPTDFGFSQESGKFLPLRLKDGGLQISYEQNLYDETTPYKVSQLVYKHTEPEKGLVITTGNKERPKTN